jgi:protein-S-isoprenylcysteine O-methyltransferase Ste14
MPAFIAMRMLYAAIILMIVPGVSLMMNSWLILTTSIAGYITFKSFIKSEYIEMENIFGEDYRKYRSETPEFFPFPRKLFR